MREITLVENANKFLDYFYVGEIDEGFVPVEFSARWRFEGMGFTDEQIDFLISIFEDMLEGVFSTINKILKEEK